jgi:hypothetical protein
LLGLIVKLGLEALYCEHKAIRPRRLSAGFLNIIERANLAR